MIFGVYGATRSGELTKVKLADVKEKGDIFLVEIVEISMLNTSDDRRRCVNLVLLTIASLSITKKGDVLCNQSEKTSFMICRKF